MIFSNVFSVSIPCSRNMSAAHILARNPNIVAYQWFRISIVEGGTIFKTLVRYLLVREGVYATGGPAFLAHAMQRVSYIVGLTAIRLASFMGYG